MWDTKDSLVGEIVTIYTCYDESEEAIVLAVSTTNDMIKVKSREDDEILIGNQWEQ